MSYRRSHDVQNTIVEFKRATVDYIGPPPTEYVISDPGRRSESAQPPRGVHVSLPADLSVETNKQSSVSAVPDLPVTALSQDHTGEDKKDPQGYAIAVYHQEVLIPQVEIYERQLLRSMRPYEAQLHDLLAGSLVPLTQQYLPKETDKIKKQALVFFASFSSKAEWRVDVGNLQPRVARVIFGLTENARDPSVTSRFVRFRFPHVSFEWSLQTPYSGIVPYLTTNKHVLVQTLWKAWAKTGLTSGLVAYGIITDKVQLMALTPPGPGQKLTVVIKERTFYVIQVSQPELMTPEAYLRKIPEYKKSQDDLMNFSTSWTVIQFLRSSNIRLGFLVAISALSASLQPLVDKCNVTAGYIFTGIGVLSGLISVVAVLLSWSLDWTERNAAKRRQSSEA